MYSGALGGAPIRFSFFILQIHEGLSEKVQVYDDIYSTKHMGKTTDTFRR